MQTKRIVTSGSIERRSTLGIQRGHEDDTKAYGARHLVPEIVGVASFVAAQILDGEP